MISHKRVGNIAKWIKQHDDYNEMNATISDIHGGINTDFFVLFLTALIRFYPTITYVIHNINSGCYLPLSDFSFSKRYAPLTFSVNQLS